MGFHCADADGIEHLASIYLNPNRILEAKNNFRTLFMRTMKFQEFHSEFSYLAQESGLASTE